MVGRLGVIGLLALGAGCQRGPAEMEEHCGDVTKNETWRYGTHLVTCDVVVAGVHLAIDSNADVTFASGTSIAVEEGGALEIAGTDRSPVSLHGEIDAPGSWEGIFYYEGSDPERNRISHTTLRGAGQYANAYRAAGLQVRGTELLAENLEIADNAGMGFVLGEGGAFAAGTTGLAVVGNELGPAEVEGAGAGSIPLGSTLTGNVAQDVIEVHGVVDRSTTWGAHEGVPYVVTGTIEVEGEDETAVLTLAAGTQILFEDDEMLRVGYGGPGALAADASGGPSIVFSTAGYEITGSWGGISLEEGTVGALTNLINVEIAWGGSYEAGLYIRQSSPRIDASYIHHNLGCGIYVSGSHAEPYIGRISYASNAEGGFCQQ